MTHTNMPLKLLFITIFLALAGSLAHCADKNELGLCPQCQEMYELVDEAVGTSVFDSLNHQFYQLAISHKDKNAELQYYLLQLRHLCRGSSKEQVQKAMEELKEKALEMGELRYYFNAYTRAAMYMTDIEKDEIAVMDLISQMLVEAQNLESEYGFCEGNRYLALIYWQKGDYVNSRKYALAAYDVYSKTKDPIIKNETVIIRTVLELSETYPIDNDSTKLFLDEARKIAAVEIDSVRCDYHESRYYARKGDMKNYAVRRDRVKSSERYYKRYYPEGDLMFEATEAAASGDWNTFRRDVAEFHTVNDLKYFAELANLYGNNVELAHVEGALVELLSLLISQSHGSDVAQLAALMGNTELSKSLNATERKLDRSNKLVITFLSAFLILLVFFMVNYILKKKREDAEKERLILKLKKSRDEADKANKLKTTFVQNMSHEIRTPLNALVGFAQLLSLPDGTLTPEEKEEFSEVVSNSSTVLIGLIDDILNMSDIETGNYKISISPFNPVSACEFALKIVEGRVRPSTKLVFENKLGGELEINSDIMRVQQILTNFLTNAIKNTEKGSITLGCTTDEAPGYVTFYVADTGIGVPPDKADIIFNRYVKLDSFKQGAGLGLSICSILSEKLGGRVYLDRNYYPGARFVLELPLK